MFLNFPIIALCTEFSVLLGNIKMHFDITLVAEKLKCMIVLITTLKYKGNNTLIFQYEQQNIQNHGVFDKKKNEYAELCHVVNFECTGWQ